MSSCDVTTRSMDRQVFKEKTSSDSAGKTLKALMSLADSACIFMSVPGLLEEPLPKNFNVCFSSVVVEVMDTSHTTLPGWNSCDTCVSDTWKPRYTVASCGGSLCSAESRMRE